MGTTLVAAARPVLVNPVPVDEPDPLSPLWRGRDDVNPEPEPAPEPDLVPDPEPDPEPPDYDTSPTMPDHLVALWDALPADLHDIINGPWSGIEVNHRQRMRRCLVGLRDRGWSLGQCLDLAEHWARDGLGRNLHWRTLLPEIWAEINEPPPEPAAPSLYDPWEDPAPPEWPGGILARPAEDTLAAISHRDGVDFGALAMSHIVAASGAAPKNSRLRPYPGGGWMVPPIVWLMLLAESGQRKTAIVNSAFGLLRRINGARWEEYTREIREWRGRPTDERNAAAKPAEPQSFVVDDSTPEKLQMLLADNPRGLLLLKDELAGWMEFGRYSKGGGAAERAFYLESYEGGPFTVHRVGRDSLHITNNALTLFGSIQPSRLAAFKGLESDGLLQRLCVVRLPPARVSRPDVVVRDMPRLDQAIERLTRQEEQTYTTTSDGAKLIQLTERDAGEFVTLTDYGVGFVGFASKLHGLHARLCLILHMLTDPDQPQIPAETVANARRLVRRYLLPHAYQFYGGLPGSNLALIRDVGGWLLTRAGDRVLASDLTTGVRGCRGLGLRDLGALLDPYVAGGWLLPESDYPGNRSWLFNGDVRRAFADRTRAERERRQAIRDSIGRIVNGTS